MSKKLKITFFIVLVLFLVFVVFRQGERNKKVDTSGIVSDGENISLSVDPNEAPPTLSTEELSEFSSILSVLQSVQIDTGLFSTNTFISLKDNSVDLGDIVVGRKNPFSKIGEDGGGVLLSQLNSQAFSIETVQPDPKTITSNSVEFVAFVEFQGGIPVDVFFEYGYEREKTQSTSPTRVTSSGFVKINIANLQEGKTYKVSSIGARGNNRKIGSPMTFTTKSQ